MTEVWKDIGGYSGIYQVSSLGRVKNTETGKILKTHKDKKGYQCTDIKYKGKTKRTTISRRSISKFNPKVCIFD